MIAKVEIQQHQIDGMTLEEVQGVSGRTAEGDDLKIRFGGQQSSHTLPEERVIVHQQDAKGVRSRLRHAL